MKQPENDEHPHVPGRKPEKPAEKESDRGLSDQRIFEQKVASGEIKYHSREDSPKPQSEGPNRKLRFGGVFRKNPTLLIILVDIILVLLVLTLVFPLIRPGAEKENFLGYSLSLHGYLYEGNVVVSVVMQPNPSYLIENGVPKQAFEIEFRILETDTRVQTQFVPVQGEAQIDTHLVRQQVPLPEQNESLDDVRVRATIEYGEERVILEKKLRQ